MTVELARSCAPYITTIINGADVVPTISPGAFVYTKCCYKCNIRL